MPKLLQINITPKGSTGRIAEQINQTAAKKGWISYFAYGRSVCNSQSQLIQIGNKLSVYEAVVEARLFDNEGLASRRATRQLVERIQEINPDIIHLHNIHGYYINYKVLFEYLNTTNIPIVWTFHDCWAFTGHCAHFVSANCERWKAGCHDCLLLNRYPASRLFDNSDRNYKLKKQLFTANKNLHIVAVSQWLGNFVKQSFFKDGDIRVINNGIDVNLFEPCSSQKHDKIRILGVSNVWTRSKGLLDFYKLREMLDENFYDITLVGLTKEQKKQLPKGIRGITRTDSVEELVALYSNADIFVNPTYADSFPTVNIEALACGTPVITYRTGGSPEIINNETGWCVEQGNLQEIQVIIEKLRKTDFSDREKQRKLCRQRAVTCFNKEDKFQEYIDQYEIILREKRES